MGQWSAREAGVAALWWERACAWQGEEVAEVTWGEVAGPKGQVEELGVYAQRLRARKRFWVEKGVFMAGLTLFRKDCSEQEQQGNATGGAEGGGGRPPGLDLGVRERLQGTLG